MNKYSKKKLNLLLIVSLIILNYINTTHKMAHLDNQINMQPIDEIDNFPAIGSGKTSNTNAFLHQSKQPKQSKQWKNLFDSKEDKISKLNLSPKEVFMEDIKTLPFYREKLSQSEMRKRQKK